MQRLIQGVQQFQSTVFHPQRTFYQQLAEGQSPEVLFIACSDSRVVPNLLTQTSPGELFIVRNAGNIVPAFDAIHGGEDATIEYAVSGLGVQDVVICGHTRCGAMDALLHPERTEKLPAVSRWLSHANDTKRRIERDCKHLTGEALWRAAIEQNVLVQLDNLSTHPCIAAAVESGRLRLHGWVYELETGHVVAFDPGENRFVPLTSYGTRRQSIPPAA